MMKVYYYPQPDKNGKYKNNYSKYYKDSLQRYADIVANNKPQSHPNSLSLFKHCFSANVYILNWVESIPFLKFGYIQFFIAMISLCIIKCRKRKIIWMFHNLVPHQGENTLSKQLSEWMFKNASAIIAHSREAAGYARIKSKCSVYYRCHPVPPIYKLPCVEKDKKDFDVLIWGTIYAYKGVYEFISLKELQESNLKVKIIGICTDPVLEAKICSMTNKNITFENRMADFSEISALCENSYYVLFPYIGKSVSSSGALIDTISLGGTPVGPNVGAFKDLNVEGVCATYTSTEEMMQIIKERRFKLSKEKRKEFLTDNSWETFGEFVSRLF